MLAAIIIIVSVIADQFTKYLVVENIDYLDTIPFIPKFMSFHHTRNTGGAWSALNGGGWERVLLLSMSLVSMALIIFILVKFYKRSRLLNISLSMVFGGALGNMIDRLRLEYVVDFLDTDFMDFPTFNIADCFITVGAVLMCVYVIFIDPKIEARIKAEKEAENSQAAEEASQIPSETEEING